MAKDSVRKMRGNRYGAILAVIFMVAVVIFLTFQIVKTRKDNEILAQNESVIASKLEEEQERNEELKERVGKGLTKDEIVRIAKERFGLVYPNEIIFVPEE